MRNCGRCSGELEGSFRFCPWCGGCQRRKLVEFFSPHPAIERAGRMLRVSRYLALASEERHVRFSIWSDAGRAEAAISLDNVEAARLGRFLEAEPSARRRPSRVTSLVETLRAAIER